MYAPCQYHSLLPPFVYYASSFLPKKNTIFVMLDMGFNGEESVLFFSSAMTEINAGEKEILEKIGIVLNMCQVNGE